MTRYIKTRHYIILLIILSLVINMLASYVSNNRLWYKLLPVMDDKVRNMHLNVAVWDLKSAAENIGAEVGEYTAVIMAINDYKVDGNTIGTISKADYMRLKNHMCYYYTKEFYELMKLYSSIISDMQNFPIPKSVNVKEWVNFTDSWGYERTYGGERTHEGVDVMAQRNIAGIYPVLSMCKGTVEKMGWLELGGYRIGIRSDSGVYYYYAHLDSYEDNLKVGDRVDACSLLGFMGNSGYGTRGTKGQFDVHLHLGIYYTANGSEISYNPYYLLKNLSENVLYYSY